LIDKEDSILRCALQNPNGIRLRDSADVLPEVAAIERLQIDIAAFPESKLTGYGRLGTSSKDNFEFELDQPMFKMPQLHAETPETPTTNLVEY
jgi:hypothetical protein